METEMEMSMEELDTLYITEKMTIEGWTLEEYMDWERDQIYMGSEA